MGPMENGAGTSTAEQVCGGALSPDLASEVKAPVAANTSNGDGAAETAGAVELLFKVANATVASLVYEASCSTSPMAAGNSPAPAREVASPGEPHGNSVQASPAPQTPQKARPGGTPPTWTGTKTGDGDSDFEGPDVCAFGGEDDDDDDGFLACTPSPGGLGRQARSEASPFGSSPGDRSGGGRGRRGWSSRQDEHEPRAAASRRAPARSGGGPAFKENRPPLPPPSGSLKALPSEHVQKFLKLVQDGDYNEALKALRKVRRAVKGRGCSKEAFGGMRALLHHLLEGFAQANRLQEALDLLESMKNGNEARLVSAAAFNAVLRGLLARSAIDEARYVVREEMVRLAVSPNEGSLNLLMDTAARAGPAYLDEAWDVLEEMQSRGLRADKYTVSILTKGITERGDKRRAPRGVVLVEHFLRSQPDDVDEVLVNSLLDVFCRMGDMPRLEATLNKMREYGIRGSAVTYGTIVKAYGKAGSIEKVLQAWAEMGRLGLEANAVTYGCMLDACVKCGHLDKALQVFSAMKVKGLHRNTILYATLIKGFAKSKDPLAARNLYSEMVMEGVTCNVVVFNSLIDACVRANDLHGAAEVLQQMTAAGVKPDLITFSTLIKGYCSNGELGKALRLAEELRARELECDEIVYNSLLEGCVKAGDLQQGLRLFTEMKQRHVKPSSVTFSILVKLLSRAGRLDLACHLVAREMREMHGVTPTRMVWSCLVTCCVKARDFTRAVMVLDLLDREGGATGSARTSMYATVIEGCLAQGEVGIALALCERAYARVPPEEGARGVLSADLLRRVFEAVGSRGPEAEARGLLDSISSRLSEQVRASLEEAMSRGARRKSPRAGTAGRDSKGGVPRVGVSEASSIATLGADALLHPSAAAGAWGGVVAAAQQWPPYMPSGFQGAEAQQALGNSFGMPMWDPANNAAAAAAAAGQWAWPGGMQGMEGYGGFYGYGAEQQYYPNPWAGQWWPGAEDAATWSAAAAAAATVAAATGPAPAPADLGLTAALGGATAPAAQEERAEAIVADTPKPESRKQGAETPSTASGGGQATVERTPATTAGRSPLAEEDEEDEQEQNSPVNMRLFAPGSATDTGAAGGGKGTPMRVEVPLSALLDGPPGLH